MKALKRSSAGVQMFGHYSRPQVTVFDCLLFENVDVNFHDERPTFIILHLSSGFSLPYEYAETKVGLMKILKVNGGRRDVLNARVYNRKSRSVRKRETEREGRERFQRGWLIVAGQASRKRRHSQDCLRLALLPDVLCLLARNIYFNLFRSGKEKHCKTFESRRKNLYKMGTGRRTSSRLPPR